MGTMDHVTALTYISKLVMIHYGSSKLKNTKMVCFELQSIQSTAQEGMQGRFASYSPFLESG
jgi:hypothetical protein